LNPYYYRDKHRTIKGAVIRCMGTFYDDLEAIDIITSIMMMKYSKEEGQLGREAT